MRSIRKIIFLAVLLYIINFFLQGNYVVFRPGTAENLKEIITVENGIDSDHEGSFFLVTVAQQPANLMLFMGSLVTPSIELFPKWRIHPPEIDLEEYYEIERRRMRDSQYLAKIIALRRMDYDVPIISDGILVVETMEDSPARDILKPEDVIIELDGERVNLAEELVQKIQERPVGSEVQITFKRNDSVLTESVTTVPHVEDREKAGLRIFIRTLDWEPQLPVEIEIGTGAIAGPSAGFMFVLEIMNQLEEQDISHGKKIVGTGTIDMREDVGPIGGIKQKVAAAEAIGADFFLVPAENMQEAERAAGRIQLVEIDTLQDALNFLETIRSDVSFLYDPERMLISQELIPLPVPVENSCYCFLVSLDKEEKFPL